MNSMNPKFCLDRSDLTIGEIYHIRNNWATNLDDVWFNNCELIDIEPDPDLPPYFTFKKENGDLLGIDGDFIEKTSGATKGTKRYQIISKKS